jgi:hypothetical protein
MKNVYLILVLLIFSLLNSSNVFGKDISKIRLVSLQIIELQELSIDNEYRLLETFDDMKRYINFNFPSLSPFDLETITYMQKAINPLHYRHNGLYETHKNFFILTSQKMYELREEAFDFWINKASIEKTEITISNIINFNSLIFADIFLSKVSNTIPENKDYIDAETFDDILFKHITREDYINYLNFIIVNSSQELFKFKTNE